MSKESPNMKHVSQAPQAEVQTKRSFSIIWVVPIIALLIGGGLAYKAMSAKGPTITISFETAEGLEANKTRIMYKDVEVGKVSNIELIPDLSGVVVTADMHKGAAEFMTEDTQFWVVRARVAAGEVSGLGTLFSGAYIGMNPSNEGKKRLEFKGLEKPPIMTAGQPGHHFILESKTLGSLDLGSPIYYRGLKVGQVVDYNFDEKAELVMIKVFVNAPYHEKVRKNTRFWNASGIDLTMNANGIKLDTQSLISIMTGGVSFGLRQNDLPGNPAEEDAQFQLYPNQSSSEKDIYTVKEYYMMYFDQSVRGLTIGAPIEIKGIQAGEVVSVDLRFDKRKLDFVIPVLVVLEPERLSALVTEEGTVITGKTKEEEIAKRSEENAPKRVQALIDKGFRAQLKTGSLLTGQLYIDLDFYPDAPPAKLAMEGGYPVFPTIPAPLEQIVERVNNILEKFEKMPLDQIVQRVDNLLEKFEKMPLEEIGQELNEAIAALTLTLKDIKMMSGNINGETLPKVNAALENLQGALKGIESTLGADSALNYNIRMITDELSTTLRSVRSLMDYLEREPQSLIFGKEGENP